MVVTDLINEQGLLQPQTVRQLDEAGKQVVKVLTQGITHEIDKLLGRKADSSINAEPHGITAESKVEANSMTKTTCSCGSGFPVAKIDINNQQVEVIALSVIFELFHQQGKRADENIANELMTKIKVYNQVRDEEEPAWRKAILCEYAAYVAFLN